MPFAVLLSFLGYTFITAFTPGPNNILALSATSSQGLGKSVKVVLGICSGFLMVMLACAALSLSISTLSPRLTEGMKYVGFLYILWLAWKTATDKGSVEAGEDGREKSRFSFWSGFILQFVNVKIILYGLLSLSGFVLPYYSSIPAMLVFSIILSVIGTLGVIAWALAGAAFQKVLQRHMRVANMVMGVLLVGCGIQIII